jgi:hypothetical protein
MMLRMRADFQHATARPMAEPRVVRTESRPAELPSDLPCSACGADVGKNERMYHPFIRNERVIVCFPCANRVGNSY